MKILKTLLGIFIALGILNCVLFKNILVFILVLFAGIILMISVRANQKNKIEPLLDIIVTGWFVMCELIPLFYKFVYKINIFEKFDFCNIFNFTLIIGPMFISILAGFGVIRVRYKN